MGKYKNATVFYRKAFENNKNKVANEQLALKMAIFGYAMSGEYSVCSKLLAKAQPLKNSASFRSSYYLTKAYVSFGKGKLADTSQFLLKSLEKAQKSIMFNRIYAASLGLATVAIALNKKSEKRTYLQKYLPLMKVLRHYANWRNGWDWKIEITRLQFENRNGKILTRQHR
ncbi:MAG TPA: hypothetical protein ENI34_02370 [candidate division WOR-3 bacterium]|uniref:Tetratricopeptide repeat protein n=1 Tax=candidate division WOR-3 bacterium TaxID=2052148 RepID=A0A9C9ELG6_UNCW3|nr:hypothetical protein [candidate division WOR-3 bacterium]